MGLTADEVVRLFEEDASARKRLAELLVSEPDVRLAVINAVIRDVATKSDLESLRKELRGEIQELREGIQDLRREMIALNEARKGDIESLRRELRGEIRDLRAELKGDIQELRGEIRDLRAEVSRNFRWTMGAIITVWGATVIPMLLRLVGLL